MSDKKEVIMYKTWANENERQDAFSGNIGEDYGPMEKAQAYGNRQRTSYLDIEPNTSVRTGFLRSDYDYFRPGESISKRQKRIIKQCMAAYDKVGIIRNVIDLMSDFSAQGLNIYHPNKTIEKFYRTWFKQVNGLERSERFLNYLYRCGNVPVRRNVTKVNKKTSDSLRRATADNFVNVQNKNYAKNVIPWSYEFLNPLAIDIASNSSRLSGNGPSYVLNINDLTHQAMMESIRTNDTIKNIFPPDVKSALESGKRQIPLNDVGMYFYKKDDWMAWANPMIYAILDDIIMLEKMKLADIAALDGAISNVRLWTLGSLDHKIIPTAAATKRLRNQLAGHVGGGTMDFVWGPELQFKESSSQVYKFLGEAKYQPVLTSIYAGLGIPPTLTGASTSGGYSNNFVSLKTLVERLEYGRDIISGFWRQELEMVRQAMGFRLPAVIKFDEIVLSDESTQKELYIKLNDRGLISDETILERFGEIPSIEKVRVKREEKDRGAGKSKPPKAGPYHNPQHKDDVAKLALTKDQLDTKVFLEELDLPYSQPEVSQPVSKIANDKYQPEGQNGRPKNSRDKQKRKEKVVLPRSGEASKSTICLWGVKAQEEISKIVTPIALAKFSKSTARSLTKSEIDQLEYFKLCIFTGMKPMMPISEAVIQELINSGNTPSEEFQSNVKAMISDFKNAFNRNPKIEELRLINSEAFCLEVAEL
jgi:hypothetical protein